jgi:hypothetical protein
VVVAVGGGKGIQLNGAEKYNVRAIVPSNRMQKSEQYLNLSLLS